MQANFREKGNTVQEVNQDQRVISRGRKSYFWG